MTGVSSGRVCQRLCVGVQEFHNHGRVNGKFLFAFLRRPFRNLIYCRTDRVPIVQKQCTSILHGDIGSELSGMESVLY